MFDWIVRRALSWLGTNLRLLKARLWRRGRGSRLRVLLRPAGTVFACHEKTRSHKNLVFTCVPNKHFWVFRGFMGRCTVPNRQESNSMRAACSPLAISDLLHRQGVFLWTVPSRNRTLPETT